MNLTKKSSHIEPFRHNSDLVLCVSFALNKMGAVLMSWSDDARRDLEVERACLRVITELALHTDAGDYARALDLFTDDAVMDRDGERFVGMDELRAAYAARPVLRLTRHVLSNTVVRVIGPDEAESISYVTVYRHRMLRSDEAPPYSLSGADVLGEYRDRFRHTSQGWKLAARITRTVLKFGPSHGDAR
jgi:hypothetical protein